MKKSLLIFIVTAIFSSWLIEGCAPSKPVQVDRMISSDRLIKRLEANRRKIKSFSGTGSLGIKTSELDAKTSFQVEIKKPDSVKISFYGPFGINLASAMMTQKDFQFYDAINNILYKGKLRPEMMKSILKVNISFDELIDMITGSVNLTEKLRREPDLFEAVDDTYKLIYIDSVSRKSDVYFVNADKLEILQYMGNDPDGKKLIDTKFSNFERFEDAPIPRVINLNDIQNSQKINIEYRTIEVNKEIGNLKIEVPDDAKIILL